MAIGQEKFVLFFQLSQGRPGLVCSDKDSVSVCFIKPIISEALLASECVVSFKGIIENNDEILEEKKVSTLLIVSAWTSLTDLKVLVIM